MMTDVETANLAQCDAVFVRMIHIIQPVDDEIRIFAQDADDSLADNFSTPSLADWQTVGRPRCSS